MSRFRTLWPYVALVALLALSGGVTVVVVHFAGEEGARAPRSQPPLTLPTPDPATSGLPLYAYAGVGPVQRGDPPGYGQPQALPGLHPAIPPLGVYLPAGGVLFEPLPTRTPLPTTTPLPTRTVTLTPAPQAPVTARTMTPSLSTPSPSAPSQTPFPTPRVSPKPNTLVPKPTVLVQPSPTLTFTPTYDLPTLTPQTLGLGLPTFTPQWDGVTVCAPSGWPVTGRLTQYFHSYHPAIDLGIPLNTPVVATHSGVVLFAGWRTDGYGNLIIIQNGPYITYYAHLTDFNVVEGQWVTRMNVIGWSGSTGNSTGPHIHYEIHIDDVPVNPLTFEDRGYPTC
ncbi:MAG: peptidoglycan DD-metalloendopeptidase family protein [Chloroflexi bacterium]|nr:peptidoglycan DD-metalloendopeptidase family protein [Chloroflexota bacterium]